MTTTERTYLTCAETAKMLRAALKAQFPGVKFSVRSHTYAGGASIDVGWADGPTEELVKQITELYRGASFDGMTDMKEYHDSLIGSPDGDVMAVHFGADFVFTSRRFSEAWLMVLAAEAPHNGRVTHPERCVGCGNWMRDQDCWTAEADREWVRFACSPMCAAKIAARYLSREAVG